MKKDLLVEKKKAGILKNRVKSRIPQINHFRRVSRLIAAHQENLVIKDCTVGSSSGLPKGHFLLFTALIQGAGGSMTEVYALI